MSIVTNIEASRTALKEVELFRNEMTIIMHTSKNVVDRETYLVFEKAHHMAVEAAIQMRTLIFDVETLQVELLAQ
jgi:hypothetical protein